MMSYRNVPQVPSSEIFIPLGDWNGHVGEKADRFEDVHGGFDYGTRSSEGERILEFARANNLFVANACFTKKESHLVTYNSSGSKSQIDFILCRKTSKSKECQSHFWRGMSIEDLDEILKTISIKFSQNNFTYSSVVEH